MAPFQPLHIGYSQAPARVIPRPFQPRHGAVPAPVAGVDNCVKIDPRRLRGRGGVNRAEAGLAATS